MDFSWCFGLLNAIDLVGSSSLPILNPRTTRLRFPSFTIFAKITLIPVVLILAACASSSVQKVGTVAYAPLPETADVIVFTEPGQIKKPYEVVGIISYDNPGKYRILTLGDAIESLKEKAREVGATTGQQCQVLCWAIRTTRWSVALVSAQGPAEGALSHERGIPTHLSQLRPAAFQRYKLLSGLLSWRYAG